jgi:hypothetical protein
MPGIIAQSSFLEKILAGRKSMHTDGEPGYV